MVRKLTLGAIATLAGALVPMLAAGPAEAAPVPWKRAGAGGHMYLPSEANARGGIEFIPQGDRIAVCDSRADGKGVRLRVKNVTKDPDVTAYTITNSRGGNECVFASAENGENLAEKHCFRLTAWLVDNGERVSEKYYVQVRNYNNDGPVTCNGVN